MRRGPVLLPEAWRLTGAELVGVPLGMHRHAQLVRVHVLAALVPVKAARARLRLAHMAGRGILAPPSSSAPDWSSSRPPRLGRPSEPSLRDGFASPDPSAHQEIFA